MFITDDSGEAAVYESEKEAEMVARRTGVCRRYGYVLVEFDLEPITT